MTDRFVSIREVSKILGVTPLTLRNWDRRGVLVAYRNPVNNYRLYRYADVLAFTDAIKKGTSDHDAENKSNADARRNEVQRLAVIVEEA